MQSRQSQYVAVAMDHQLLHSLMKWVNANPCSKSAHILARGVMEASKSTCNDVLLTMRPQLILCLKPSSLEAEPFCRWAQRYHHITGGLEIYIDDRLVGSSKSEAKRRFVHKVMLMAAAKEQDHILNWLEKIGLGTLTSEAALEAYEDLCFTKCYRAAEFPAAEAEFVSALSFIKQQTTIDLQRLREKAAGGLCTEKNPRVDVGTIEKPIMIPANKIDCSHSVSRSVLQLLCSQRADWPIGSIPSAIRAGVNLDDVPVDASAGCSMGGIDNSSSRSRLATGKTSATTPTVSVVHKLSSM